MERISNIKHNAINILFVCWYALGLFITSNSFCNVENDIKKYLAIFGGLVVIVFILLTKKPRGLVRHICSPVTMHFLFITGAFLALYGLLQYISIFPSNHPSFRITGSFENPAGITAVLALLFPIGVSWCINSHRIIKIAISSLLLLYLSAIVLSGARTAIISIIVSSLVVLSIDTTWLKRLLHSKVLASVVIILICGVSILLFQLKANSTYGRLFIWKTSMPLIFDKIWLGHGINGFKSEYMYEQANYFQQHEGDRFAWLADNISHPFNEFINVAFNFGIIGLLVFMILITIPITMALRHRGWYSSVVVACYSSFAVLATFSYPLQYAPVWILMTILFILPFTRYLPKRIHVALRIIFISFTFIAFYFLYHTVIAELNWKRIADRSLEGQTEQMIPFYQKIHDNTILRYDGYFLYNYAAELNFINRYDESLQILHECLKEIYDYDVALLYADNYQNIHQNDSVIKYATLASNMIPCRFLPYSYLLQAYNCKKDKAHAILIAKKIHNKKVKIPSPMVDEVKSKADNYLKSQ
ncbi:MAG: O-antigen ligase family protein [Bacteroidaceae bacterium]|nr:O-antigen ligase family protein [Bacteroidaceae bacterium]